LSQAVPIDLAGVVVATLLVDALVLASVGWTPVRFVLGMAFLFFLPGYAVLAALYPERPRRSAEDPSVVPQLVEPHEGLVFGERLALSVGTGLALVPVLAVGLGALGLGLTPRTILGSLTVIVVGCAAIGAVRRARLAPDSRYVPFGRRAARGDGGTRDRGRSRGSRILAAGLVVAVALAGGAFAYGIAAEPPSTSYTSASLLTAGDGASPVAGAYPANVSAGESVELTLRVDNHRSATVNVTAVGVLERVADGGDLILDSERMVTRNERLSPNERWNATHEVTPTFGGEDLRLAYYLYHGEPPDAVGPETADREVHLRIDVDEA
jgi:uncharacterized membrane protein